MTTAITVVKSLIGKVGEIEMNLANFRNDENGNQYGLKRCKYHCDYGDGEYCHYKEHDGCIYNKSQDEQIKGRRMSDAESMGMLFDDPPGISLDAFIKWWSDIVLLKEQEKLKSSLPTLIKMTKTKNEYLLICGFCKHKIDALFRFCPYCGREIELT